MLRLPLFFIPLLLALLVGCGSRTEESNKLTKEQVETRLAALSCAADEITLPDGPTGGTFRFNSLETPNSLDPAWIRDTASSDIGTSIHEGLIEFDPVDMSVKPCIAESWEISEDGLTYTFKLRAGVFFQDNPCFPDGQGREVVASDFKYSFERVCDPRVASPGAWMFLDFVEGSNAYRDGVSARRELERRASGEGRDPNSEDRFRAAEDAQLQEWAASPDEVVGFACPDDRTFVVKLAIPFSPFIFRLGHSFSWVVPKEAVEFYGDNFFKNPVGAGPFKFVEWIPGQKVVLEKHPKYWMKDANGHQLPYLDRIEVSRIEDTNSEHYELLNGHLDFQFPIPIDQWDSIFDADLNLKADYKRFQVQWVNTWRIEYIGMLNTDPLFKDVRVRQAFNYAIDREEIGSTILRYRAIPNRGQVVPGSMPDYPSEDGPFKYDPTKARELLAEAGYPNGQGFPELTLQLNSAGRDNEKIAEIIQAYLAVIGVKVQLKVVDWRVHLDTVREGKVPFYRLGWINDYPSPENSLMLVWGKNIPPMGENYARYQNEKFDELFEKALSITDIQEQNKVFREAEEVAVQEAPWLFLYTMRRFRLVAPEVRGFPFNAGDRRFLKYTWLDKSS
ncbi:MAG: ABC transporter substrate-binding protein [Candidatus Omnitrophica bacterium]|nr:ABC transporter substrate-binding protein [Candidatus Omnitrophota bacterium]